MLRLQEIISAASSYIDESELERIREAFAFASDMHQGQTRASGEPYISHVAAVALLATRLRLDTASIITALLHDTVEDTEAKLSDLSEKFGEEVATLVDGVTKISRVNFSTKAEQQAENFRKMLLAMAEDIRVLLIKLCDRTHNMRTLQYLTDSKKQRISQETREIYAPLAHRLGIYWIKSELEDLSFRYLQPQAWTKLDREIASRSKERERYVRRVSDLLSKELENAGIKANISGRPKNLYSVYQKMERLSVSVDEVHDLIAFRVIVDSTMNCYASLGIIHSAWKPIPGRFKDYIAMPKGNGYQSVHTTVFGPDGQKIEIQIRTEEMHEIAEKGLAAHWTYKESDGGKLNPAEARNFAWLRDLIESEKALENPHQFMQVVKGDLFPQEVFVFTPRGDLVDLPQGSTPVDFAYSIHSDIGDSCQGARVNGQQVPLDHVLKNGDTVEVNTSNKQRPNKDWLRFVASSRAKQCIRAWIKNQELQKSLGVGKELLTKELRRFGGSFSSLSKSGEILQAATKLGYNSENSLLADLGYGKIATESVAELLFPDASGKSLPETDSAIKKIFQQAAKVLNKNDSQIKVSGLDDVVFRFARCCEPLPGDNIIGYVTRGRGVTVHRADCHQVVGFDNHRFVEVDWESGVKSTRAIVIKILSLNQVGVLASITNTISSQGANISKVEASVGERGKGVTIFEVNIESSQQLSSLISALEGLEGVLKVQKIRSSLVN